MAQRNDEVAGMVIVFAFVGVVMFFMAVIIFVMATIAALVLTIWAALAWDRPVTFGAYTAEPEEARAFIIRGLIGAVVVPLFTYSSVWLLGGAPGSEWLGLLVITGYDLGSVGVLLLVAQHEQEQAMAARFDSPVTPVAPQPMVPPVQQLPLRQDTPPPPFRFASWDDEGDEP